MTSLGESFSPQAIVQSYKQRGTMENFIKEAKNGFGFHQMKSHDFLVNEARMMLSLLAYHFTNWLRTHCFPKKYKGIQIQTICTITRALLDIVQNPAIGEDLTNDFRGCKSLHKKSEYPTHPPHDDLRIVYNPKTKQVWLIAFDHRYLPDDFYNRIRASKRVWLLLKSYSFTLYVYLDSANFFCICRMDWVTCL